MKVNYNFYFLSIEMCLDFVTKPLSIYVTVCITQHILLAAYTIMYARVLIKAYTNAQKYMQYSMHLKPCIVAKSRNSF